MTYIANIPRTSTTEEARKIARIDAVLKRGLIRPAEEPPGYVGLYACAAAFGGLAAALAVLL